MSHKKLSFNRLISDFKSVADKLPDYRTGNTKYTMSDAALGAFSVFFMQSCSFLDAQRQLEQAKGKSNSKSLFSMFEVMSDNHLRNMLDEVKASEFSPVFSKILNDLQKEQELDQYRGFDGRLLVALDGIHYFSSKEIHCEKCTVKEHGNGEVSYSHTMIAPAIVAPNNAVVIPLWPEHIQPQDGHKKQDCENAAAKRWLASRGQELQALGVTVLGDDLYSRQPIVEALAAECLEYILVCKETSHKTLYKWKDRLDDEGAVSQLEKQYEKGKYQYSVKYKYVNELPIKSGNELEVNWCEVIETRSDGKQTYKNAFITSHWITDQNIVNIIESGRARWKIENENNGTLKTRGYHVSHNFGHGKNNLCETLVTLNVLAFLFHSVMDLRDVKYQLIRSKLPRKKFYDDVRALTSYFVFDSWDALLEFMMKGLEIELPKTA